MHRLLDGAHDAHGIGGREQQVAAGGERAHPGLGLVHAGQQPNHVESVGDDEPLEAHVAAEHRDDGRRYRGRHVRAVERGVRHVRRHDARHAGVDGGPERQQVAGLQLGEALLEHRRGEMRIGGRVAVPRKMLGAGEHALGLARVNPVGRELRHARGISAETSRADNGVAVVEVEVADRAECPVEPQLARVAGGEARGAAHRVGIIERGQRARGRQRHGAMKAFARAALHIGGDEQWMWRVPVQRAHQLRHLVARAAAQQEAADAQGQRTVYGLAGSRPAAFAVPAQRRDDVLPQLLHGALRPACSCQARAGPWPPSRPGRCRRVRAGAASRAARRRRLPWRRRRRTASRTARPGAARAAR